MALVRILILEDLASDAELAIREIRQAVPDTSILVVATAAEFEEALQDFAPDLVLSDHHLGGFTGREALQLARARRPETPFILLTGSLDDETAVEYMKAGAADYVLKDRATRLGPAIVSAVQQKQLAAQLRQSQRMEAIGQLAGGVAHDFNNILMAITGFAELLLNRLRPESEEASDAREIRDAAERGSALTRQLLAFSRRQVLSVEELNLNTVVRNLERMLHRLISERITLHLHLEPDLGTVRADPGQLEQVLLNLVVNARDAIPESEPGLIHIQTSNEELDQHFADEHLGVSPGSYVLLTVTDSGMGMDAETKARVFEPFFTTKPPGQGTGLGLSTVYGIVRQSGGHIWMYSDLGVGTTAAVYLPRVAGDAGSRPVAAATAPPRPGGTETLLVVDDDALVREVCTRTLEGAGYHVLPAPHPAAAMALVRKHRGRVHLMITDV